MFAGAPNPGVVEWGAGRGCPLLAEGHWRLGHAGCAGVCEVEGNSRRREEGGRRFDIEKSQAFGWGGSGLVRQSGGVWNYSRGKFREKDRFNGIST